MKRSTKIELLEFWLKSPENMGKIPEHLKHEVTAKEFFDIKREMDWKPLTKENVQSLFTKTKLIPTGGFRVQKKGNPMVGVIVFVFMIMFSIPLVFVSVIQNIFSGDVSSVFPLVTIPFILFGAFMIFIFITMAKGAMKNLSSISSVKNYKGHRREFHTIAKRRK